VRTHPLAGIQHLLAAVVVTSHHSNGFGEFREPIGYLLLPSFPVRPVTPAFENIARVPGRLDMLTKPVAPFVVETISTGMYPAEREVPQSSIEQMLHGHAGDLAIVDADRWQAETLQ